MRKVQFYYPQLRDKTVGNKLAIWDSETSNRAKVLRINIENPQYEYILTDGKGNSARASIKKITKEGIQFKLEEYIERDAIARSASILIPMIKPARLEQCIDYVTQLNFYLRIVIYFSEFNRFTEQKFSDQKLTRWGKIAINSMNQSKSSLLPEISTAESLSEAIESIKDKNNIMIAPDPNSPKFSHESLEKALGGNKNIVLAIGPEAGFSKDELDLLLENPNYTFSFGNSILTTDAAGTIFSGLLISASS